MGNIMVFHKNQYLLRMILLSLNIKGSTKESTYFICHHEQTRAPTVCFLLDDAKRLHHTYPQTQTGVPTGSVLLGNRSEACQACQASPGTGNIYRPLPAQHQAPTVQPRRHHEGGPAIPRDDAVVPPPGWRPALDSAGAVVRHKLHLLCPDHARQQGTCGKGPLPHCLHPFRPGLQEGVGAEVLV